MDEVTVIVRTAPGVPEQAVHHARWLMRRQASLMSVVGAVVVWLDQITKAWAWRHLTDVHVNTGGDALSTAQLSSWLRQPATGAVFDVIDAGVLAGAALLLARARRPPGVSFFGALALAGWSSNLLDRLGMHHLTAPGSARGAVDFLPFAGRYWNFADIAIVSGTLGLVLAVLMAVARARPARLTVLVIRNPLASRWAPPP